MADTSIEWADYTFNPWIGCAKVAAGCKNCYAEKNMVVTMGAAKGTWGKDARRHVTSDAYWQRPLAWARKYRKKVQTIQRARQDLEQIDTDLVDLSDALGYADELLSQHPRPRVFCGSLCDVFEDRDDLLDVRGRLFDLIERTPELDWLLLTKRPGVAADLVPWKHVDPWPNVWLGTSVACQEDAGRNIPELLKVPAAVRFVSAEPLVGPVDLRWFLHRYECSECGAAGEGDSQAFEFCDESTIQPSALDWVIAGGESGKDARPCDVEWIRSIVRQCAEAEVPCFVKQLGSSVLDRNDAGFDGEPADAWPEWTETDDFHLDPQRKYQGAPCEIRLKSKKGGDPAEWPAELRVRDFPRRD